MIMIISQVFSKKCKCNKEKPYKSRWVFGISKPDQHKCYLQVVKSKDEATLLGIIIAKHVTKNTPV